MRDPDLHDWAYLELADLNAGEYNSALTGEWTRGLSNLSGLCRDNGLERRETLL